MSKYYGIRNLELSGSKKENEIPFFSTKWPFNTDRGTGWID